MEFGPWFWAETGVEPMKALPQTALKKIAGRSHIRTALPSALPSI
jgi:hypothetical protein